MKIHALVNKKKLNLRPKVSTDSYVDSSGHCYGYFHSIIVYIVTFQGTFEHFPVWLHPSISIYFLAIEVTFFLPLETSLVLTTCLYLIMHEEH